MTIYVVRAKLCSLFEFKDSLAKVESTDPSVFA